MESNIPIFFDKAQHIIDLNNQKKREADLRGENYNIFSILGLEKRETKLHSAFLADLLNSEGLHALNSQPLELFIKKNWAELETYDASKIEVSPEFRIGPINEDYTEGGNIDILIDIDGKLLVIENKINAIDQPNQLVRYKNYCKNKNHKLFYLTLYGHEPSEKSSGNLVSGKDYYCISYRSDILDWLKEIYPLTIAKPLIRETLSQYISTIKYLTNQNMDEKDLQNLFAIMTDYPEVVCAIKDKQWNYRLYLVTKYFIEPMKDWCNENGFNWYEDEGFRKQESINGFGIYKDGWKKIIATEFASSGFIKPYYGIWIWESEDKTQHPLLGEEPNESWPYGWEYFDKYTSWDASISKDFKEMKVFNYVKEKFEDLIKRIEPDSDKFNME